MVQEKIGLWDQNQVTYGSPGYVCSVFHQKLPDHLCSWLPTAPVQKPSLCKSQAAPAPIHLERNWLGSAWKSYMRTWPYYLLVWCMIDQYWYACTYVCACRCMCIYRCVLQVFTHCILWVLVCIYKLYIIIQYGCVSMCRVYTYDPPIIRLVTRGGNSQSNRCLDHIPESNWSYLSSWVAMGFLSMAKLQLNKSPTWSKKCLSHPFRQVFAHSTRKKELQVLNDFEWCSFPQHL